MDRTNDITAETMGTGRSTAIPTEHRWSRRSSLLAIILLSLLGWALVGTILLYLLGR